jgi:hypothetical protein
LREDRGKQRLGGENPRAITTADAYGRLVETGIDGENKNPQVLKRSMGMMKKEIKITYTYDPLNRLKAVARDGETSKHYGYDPAGNLITISPELSEKNKETLAGKENDNGKEKEPASGTPEMRFAAMEEEYERLNLLAQAGSISLEQFQEGVNQLRFQDVGETWWQMNADGTWLKWDGKAWVKAEPTSE